MDELTLVRIQASDADVVADAHATFCIHYQAILAAAAQAILFRVGDETRPVLIQAADPPAWQIDGCRDPEATVRIFDYSVHPVAPEDIVQGVNREAGAIESRQTTPVCPQPQLTAPILYNGSDAGSG
jgi:hypothetical protein